MNNSTAANETRPRDESITSFAIMAWSIAFGMLAVMATTGNSTVIVAFARNTKLHTRTNYIIVGLATADLLVGLIAVPLYIGLMLFYTRHLVAPESLKAVYNVADIFGGFSSIFHLMLISLERLYAIALPVNHRNSSKWLYVAALIVSWSVSGTLSFLHSLRHGNSDIRKTFLVLMWIFFTVAFIVICTAYIVIWRKAKERKLLGRGFRRGLRRQDREIMIAMSLLIVIIVFVVTWLPFFCINTIYFFASEPTTISFQVIQFTKLLHYCNSAINPIVYSLKIPGFKKTFTSLLRWESVRSLRASFSLSRRESSKKPTVPCDQDEPCLVT